MLCVHTLGIILECAGGEASYLVVLGLAPGALTQCRVA
jgi:hypothetical protein